MDALKLAFETVIIGLFALPWLWVLVDLVNPGLFSPNGIRRLMALVPTELRAPAIGLTLFSVVYLLGSMITPVACEFLNDPDMLGTFLPTEAKIQARAYSQMSSPPPIPGLLVPEDMEPANFRSFTANSDLAKEKDFQNVVHNAFLHDESALLLQGPAACERLNRLHEQLTVLRGAAFSAFALMVVCGFAWCGRCHNDSSGVGFSSWRLIRRSIALGVCVMTLALAGYGLWEDAHHPEAGDIPIAELVLLMLGGFGLFVLIWGTRSRLQFHGMTCGFALCFAALCYAGYGCLETSYDQAVFSAYQALPHSTDGEKAHTHAGARSEMAAITGEER